MRALLTFVVVVVGAASDVTAEPAGRSDAPALAWGAERSGTSSVDLLDDGSPSPGPSAAGGLVGTTLEVVDNVLDKLGIDRDELMEALSEVELSGAGDNWREESSGEVGLSFGITEHLSIGPSFGLRYEEENFAGPREAWSQQLKLGARYNF